MKLRVLLFALLVCVATQRAQASCSMSVTIGPPTVISVTYKVASVGITYIASETTFWPIYCYHTFPSSGEYAGSSFTSTGTGDWGLNTSLTPVACNPTWTPVAIGSSGANPPGATLYTDSWVGNLLGVGNPPGCQISSETVQTYTCPSGCPSGSTCPGCPSPIILDLNGRGFDLTNAACGVLFDITGSGNPVQVAWTALGADNAFLALPGPDGMVHNGKQLFGNYTPQPPSDDPNGFLALAVYDQPVNGGNGDGIIDAHDAIWPSLRLWIDTNHDGISLPVCFA